jgi:solute carrier family 10 (sodium/bile acid cotransporter), member 7
LGKLGGICLLLVIWAAFSSCFYYQALKNISHESVILVCFLNVGLYIFFTLFSLLIARPPIFPRSHILHKVFYRFSKHDTIAICFCAPAKSVSIGVPLIGAMWGAEFSNSVQSLVMVPVILYQAEQILCGQIAVILFRRWLNDELISAHASLDQGAVMNKGRVVEEVKGKNIESVRT